MDNTAALILAGGKGTRMGLLCEERPKPILPFAGRYRVIDFSLSNCINSEVDEVAVLTNYQRVQMRGYLKNWHVNNRGPCNLTILEPRINHYKGTADAIFQNLGYLKSIDADTILVLAADHIYEMDYAKMVEFHKKTGADVTLGVIEVPIKEAYRFGILKIDNENRVTDYEEKPDIPRNNLASMGIYVFNKNTLLERIENYGNRQHTKHDMTYTIIPEILERDRFFVHQFYGYWRDIGTVKAYYSAHMETLDKECQLLNDTGRPVLGSDYHSTAECSLGKNANNSIISRGCSIRGHVENSILSPGVTIEDNAIVKNSILMSEVYVGSRSIIDNCIIDSQVDVGSFSYIGFGNSSPDDDETTILGRGVSIPSGTAIGHNCRVRPEVKPEDFDGIILPSGSVI